MKNKTDIDAINYRELMGHLIKAAQDGFYAQDADLDRSLIDKVSDAIALEVCRHVGLYISDDDEIPARVMARDFLSPSSTSA